MVPMASFGLTEEGCFDLGKTRPSDDLAGRDYLIIEAQKSCVDRFLGHAAVIENVVRVKDCGGRRYSLRALPSTCKLCGLCASVIFVNPDVPVTNKLGLLLSHQRRCWNM
jgi:hypothetical protein